ncbi:hypothetical protein QR98_0021000 [Sarcoptes scabiei]|nr:hypothetical protein QR98_0021000 [Sarcoptes scabiei]
MYHPGPSGSALAANAAAPSSASAAFLSSGPAAAHTGLLLAPLNPFYTDYAAVAAAAAAFNPSPAQSFGPPSPAAYADSGHILTTFLAPTAYATSPMVSSGSASTSGGSENLSGFGSTQHQSHRYSNNGGSNGSTISSMHQSQPQQSFSNPSLVTTISPTTNSLHQHHLNHSHQPSAFYLGPSSNPGSNSNGFLTGIFTTPASNNAAAAAAAAAVYLNEARI